MDDTSPEIAEKLREMYAKKTPFERHQMGWSMWLTSKQLIICAILRENPNISKAGLRREVFLRFYGEDFNLEEREKIIAHLEQHAKDKD